MKPTCVASEYGVDEFWSTSWEPKTTDNPQLVGVSELVPSIMCCGNILHCHSTRINKIPNYPLNNIVLNHEIIIQIFQSNIYVVGNVQIENFERYHTLDSNTRNNYDLSFKKQLHNIAVNTKLTTTRSCFEFVSLLSCWICLLRSKEGITHARSWLLTQQAYLITNPYNQREF